MRNARQSKCFFIALPLQILVKIRLALMGESFLFYKFSRCAIVCVSLLYRLFFVRVSFVAKPNA